MSNLTLGSLFDGSGGFPLGGLISGITPVWASEIEPFPIRVTTKRLPFMKHYGDISAMDGGKVEPVDIICFGSPCTDMSVAGLRAGLGGKQSVLFYEAIRIIKEMRCATNGKYPRWICWENVPGAFSSNAGHDFQAVLEAVIGIVEPETQVPMPEKNKWPESDIYMGDGWSVAYRTLDAQYWGLAQRRKRIFLIGDLTGQCAGEVLFKSEGLSGYSAEGFRAWQRAAGCTEESVGATGFGLDGYNGAISDTAATLGVNCGMSTGRNGVVLNDQGGNRMDVTHDVTCTLRAEAHHPPVVLEEAPAVYENHSQDTRYVGPLAVAPTVAATYGTGGNNQPFVIRDEAAKTLKIRSGCEGGGKGALIQDDMSATLSCNNDQTVFVPRVYGICAKDSNAMKSDNPHSGFYEAETTRTLDGNGGNPTCNQGGVAIVESYAIQGSMIGRKDKNGPQGDGINEDVSFTLNTVDRHAVATPTFCSSKASFFTQAEEELANTLVATDYKDPPVINGSPEYTVRRLTPTECARLQGFPDWWCSGLGTAEPTTEDLRYWYEVFETHRKIVGTSSKPKSIKQIAKWLRDPHSDAAEYKMWGNGVALPCVVFVLSGIVFYTQSNRT